MVVLLVFSAAGVGVGPGSATSGPNGSPVATSADGSASNESDAEPASIFDDIIPKEDLEQRVRIHPNDSTLVPGRNYTVSVVTNVEVRESLWDLSLDALFDVFKETSVTDPWLNVSVSGEGATPEITGVVSETDQYNATRRGIDAERVQVSTDEFGAGSIHRTLIRVHVPPGIESVTIRAQTGRGDSADTEEKSDVAETYPVGDSLTRWEKMAAIAEARAETAAHLNRTYESMLNTTSVEEIVDQGMRSVFVESAHTMKKIHSLGKATGVAKQFVQYYRSVRSDEKFDGPWVGPMIRATNDMWESGIEQMALKDVREAGNSSRALERLHRLASEEATAWRAHDRAKAREKLREQYDVVYPPGDSTAGKLLYQAQDQEREASLEDREGVRVYFEGLMSFSLAKSDEIDGILPKTPAPDPSVTLRNPAKVREQLGEEGTVRATFEVSNKGGPTSIYGFLSLVYSNDTLDLTGIRQVDEEEDGEVLRDTVFRAADLGEYTNDTLTNTYVAGKERVLTRDGDREYVGRTLTDVYERFEPGEHNVYEVTFERTGAADAPANLTYRLAFQPFVHEPANQSEFVRAPASVSADARLGAQGWPVDKISAADGGDDSGPAGRFVDVAPADLPGSGTEADPYVLTNASELQAMAEGLAAHYVLGSDVNASGTADWNGGKGFDPVGVSPRMGTGFTGSFDGAGHTITGLTIDRAGERSVGLFGGIGAGGTVEAVGLAGVDVTAGGYQAGGLAGVNDGGRIAESFATGSVTGEGDNTYAGGLVGTIFRGSVNDSYATVTVAGPWHVGGLAGRNSDTIARSYAAGTVTASGDDVGGLVGEASGAATDAYWDIAATGQEASGSGTGLATARMTGDDARGNMTGFDFPGTWRVRPGHRPALAWQESTTADDDRYTTSAGETLSVGAPGVLVNDLNLGGDDLSVTATVDRPSNGDLVLSEDGSFMYTPDPGFGGRDGFSYRVSDGEGHTALANVTVVVNGFVDVDPADLPGSGSGGDPYVVSNASELQAMADDLDAHYVLGSDVDASGTAVWNDGRGFKPVGSNPFDGGGGFTGTFDGAGHRITGLTIDRSDGEFAALYAGVGEGSFSTTGTVERVLLADVNVTGGDGVSGAALVGINSGTVREAAATGSVSGSKGAGGLVRTNVGTVEDAYARVNVTVAAFGGGVLVGLNDAGGTIRTSYATETVTGYDGGLVGGSFGTVTDAYWDTASGSPSSPDVTGLATDEMTGDVARTNMAGFDFPGTWRARSEAYPVLAWQESAPNAPPAANDDSYNATENGVRSVGAPGVLANDTDPDGDALAVTAVVNRPSNGTLAIDTDGSFEYTPDPDFHGRDAFTYEVGDPAGSTDRATVTLTVARDTTFVDVAPTDLPGAGTTADPYVISNASELQAMADAPGAHYELGSDVNASGTAEWNDDRGFDPVGEDPAVGSVFDGSFDGAGHTISNLSINRSGENYVGLFGYASDGRYLPLPTLSNATIENVTLVNATVAGSDYVGGLAGFSAAAVKDASVAGAVDGNGSVGGLIGSTQAGAKVSRTSAGGSVTGATLVGGLLGDNRGTVLRSYATGAVTGSETEVGGLVGQSTGTLKQSYATGAVTGAGEVGGLVGYSNVGVIDQSYAVGSVTGTGDRGVGGLVGDNAFTPIYRSFWDTDATGQAASDKGTGLTTAQMTGKAAAGNMTGFDFDGTWAASPGEYPRLVMTDAYEPPALADDRYQAARNATLSVGAPGVLANDTDPDGDALSVTAVIDGASNGSVRVDADGSFEYVPETGFVGLDTFTYVANADGGGTEVATVRVSVKYPVAIVGPDDLAGEGTPESPYVVTNASELQAMEDDLDAHYVLGSDIDASRTGTWHDDRGFDPVGSSSFSGGTPFDGAFDGAGHVITGLTIDRSGTDYVGLFGVVGLDGSIENVTLSGGSIVGADSTGGIAGFTNGNVTRSGARVTVTGGSKVGGLVGSVGYGGLVTGSFANGSTAAVKNAGGLVGENSGGTVAGSYATGAVDGDAVAGGLVGRNDREGTIRESWAAGTVTRSRSVGGLVGSNDATVNASYWDTGATGQDASAGGTPLTTDEMTGRAAPDSMTALNFSADWETRPGKYPALIWQNTSSTGGATTCIADSISGKNDEISLAEIQTAIDWWAEGEAVPGTGGEKISLATIQRLIDAWAESAAVSCSG